MIHYVYRAIYILTLYENAGLEMKDMSYIDKVTICMSYINAGLEMKRVSSTSTATGTQAGAGPSRGSMPAGAGAGGGHGLGLGIGTGGIVGGGMGIDSFPMSHSIQNLDPQNTIVSGGVAVEGGCTDLTSQTPEDQVIELVRALLLHMRTSEGKEWVDITNMPKAAHMLQRKRPVVGVSLRWGSRDVGPEEWQRLMAEIRARHGKLANFLSKHSSVFELRSRPGGKVRSTF